MASEVLARRFIRILSNSRSSHRVNTRHVSLIYVLHAAQSHYFTVCRVVINVDDGWCLGLHEEQDDFEE